GRSWDELDGYFTLMLAADDYPGFTFAAGARYEEPSWNLRSIYTGLNSDDPNDYPAWPLAARPFPFGSWTASIDALAGGSAALFDISGTQGAPQLIDVHAVDGTPPAAGSPLRMVILRIQ
ncbi:MAG: hypothetical protein KGL93_12780, partial [Gemmatimonadota bacterium]|nr:hypothetical protein [Gemmatimonadota bacterium]